MTTLLKIGLHPAASDALKAAGVAASQVSQTLGNAPASHGTHAEDGEVNGVPYSAAVDLRVGGMSDSQIKALLGKLAENGFAAFYRHPGHDHWPANERPHIHAVYCGCRCKFLLRAQVHDWCNGMNGLLSHAKYSFWQPTQAQENVVRTLFLAHNPAVG